MDNPRESQSFSVDDIRKVREEDDRRYRNMSMEEIAENIHRRAAEGHKIIDEIKKQRMHDTSTTDR